MAIVARMYFWGATPPVIWGYVVGSAELDNWADYLNHAHCRSAELWEFDRHGTAWLVIRSPGPLFRRRPRPPGEPPPPAVDSGLMAGGGRCG